MSISVYKGSRQSIILIDGRRKISINQIDIVERKLLCDLVDNVHPENGGFRPADSNRNIDRRRSSLLGREKRSVLRKFVSHFLRRCQNFPAQVIGNTFLTAEYLPDSGS